MLRKSLLSIAVVAALATATALPARACPSCKEAVSSQSPEDAARLKNGYFYSILLMIGMPFTLAGAGIFFVSRAIKRGDLPNL